MDRGTELDLINADAEGDLPLRRAEGIVKDGPSMDAGKQPCEDEPEAQCLTFTDLNRMRFERAPCGCTNDAGTILPCEEHGGGVATQEEIDAWIAKPVMGGQLGKTVVVNEFTGDSEKAL